MRLIKCGKGLRRKGGKVQREIKQGAEGGAGREQGGVHTTFWVAGYEGGKLPL